MVAVGAMALLASQAAAGNTDSGVTTPPVNFELPANALRSWIGMYVGLATLAAVVVAVVYATHAVPATRARLLPRALSLRWARRQVAGEAGQQFLQRIDRAALHRLKDRPRAQPTTVAMLPWLLRLRWARRLADGQLEREHFLRGLERVDLERLKQQQRTAAAALKQWLAHRRESDVPRHVDVVEPYDRELSGDLDARLLGSFHNG